MSYLVMTYHTIIMKINHSDSIVPDSKREVLKINSEDVFQKVTY